MLSFCETRKDPVVEKKSIFCFGNSSSQCTVAIPSRIFFTHCIHAHTNSDLQDTIPPLPFHHHITSSPRIQLTTSTTSLITLAVLGKAIVAAPSVFVALVHVGDCPLLGDDVRSVGPCISQSQNDMFDIEHSTAAVGREKGTHTCNHRRTGPEEPGCEWCRTCSPSSCTRGARGCGSRVRQSCRSWARPWWRGPWRPGR